MVTYMGKFENILTPIFLVMNKTDILAEDKQMLISDQKELLLQKFPFLQRAFPISALRNTNVSDIVVSLLNQLFVVVP